MATDKRPVASRDLWSLRFVGDPNLSPSGDELVWVESWTNAKKNHYESAIYISRREGGKLALDVTVPANTAAMVYVPAKDPAGVTESGKPLAQAEGVKLLRTEGGAAVVSVGGGTYRFESKQ